MKILKPSPDVTYDIVASIIAAVAKPVILKQAGAYTPCPVCAGNDPFCETCHGSGSLYSVNDVTVLGSVRWKALEQKKYRPEGQYVEGDCSVTISYSATIEALMYNVKEVVVDNRKCVVDHWNLRGSPTNRIYLVLTEDESLIGQRVS